MKRLLLFLLPCIWAVSCVKDVDIAPEKRVTSYSLEEAKAFFDDYVATLPEINTRAYDDHSLFGIDLSPQWDKAVASSRNSLSSIDIPILENRQLMAQTSGIPLYINSLQKLVIVKDHETDVQGAYLLTLVPDLQYSHNKQFDPNSFVNLGDKNNYSGLAIYSLPLTEHIVRIDRYKNGEKIEGYGLFGTCAEIYYSLVKIRSIFEEISFGIGEMVQTRTIIEGGTIPPVIVTPNRCSWCNSTTCDGWCWTGGGGGGLPGGGDSPDPNPGGGTGGGGTGPGMDMPTIPVFKTMISAFIALKYGSNSLTYKMINHYMHEDGSTHTLSQADWAKIKNIATDKLGNPDGTVTINGVTYQYKVVSFYGDSDLAKSIGNATIFYTSPNNIVGFYDRYDFNSSDHRDLKSEILTAFGRSIPESDPFDIIYGVYKKP